MGTPRTLGEEATRETLSRDTNGERTKDIAVAMQVSRGTVFRTLQRNGVARRSRSLPTMPLADCFWAKVARGKPDECWLWTGMMGSTGYGSFGMTRSTMRKAHRVAFFLTHGRWPNVARHTCDVRRCCNPAHLLDGTHADNVRDMVERNRVSRSHQPKGSKHSQAKLTESDVALIRSLASQRTQASLASEFGVWLLPTSDSSSPARRGGTSDDTRHDLPLCGMHLFGREAVSGRLNLGACGCVRARGRVLALLRESSEPRAAPRQVRARRQEGPRDVCAAMTLSNSTR